MRFQERDKSKLERHDSCQPAFRSPRPQKLGRSTAPYSNTSGGTASGAETMTAGRGRDEPGAATRNPLAASPLSSRAPRRPCRPRQWTAFVFILACLFALPAAAQTTTIWSATLTVDVWIQGVFTNRGCISTGHPSGDACSVVLSDDDFTHGGATYVIDSLWWNESNSALLITFTGVSSSVFATGLSGASLNLDDNMFPIASGTLDHVDRYVRWVISDPGWTDGQQVSVSLTIPRAPDPDPDPEPTTTPPTVKITAASTAIAPGGTVALTATATDSDGTIASYRWGARPVSRSYYSTTTGEFSTTSGAETEWTAPERADKYHVRVRVWDNGGDTARDNVTITVEDVAPVPALPGAGLVLLAFVLAVRGARGVRTRALPPAGSRLSANADRPR